MKGRLVMSTEGNYVFLWPDGNIMQANDVFLHALLLHFNDIEQYRQKGEGIWKSDAVPSMEVFPGETLAFVTDDNFLIVSDPSPFCRLVEDIHNFQKAIKYITAVEYAKIHDRSSVMITTYCRNGRIPGAKRVGENWMIPEHAPYPKLEHPWRGTKEQIRAARKAKAE